jgi:hypothetical protein
MHTHLEGRTAVRPNKLGIIWRKLHVANSDTNDRAYKELLLEQFQE